MEMTLCYIIMYTVEAFIIYAYLDFVFERKQKLICIILSFSVFYSVLYMTFSVGNMLLNAILYTLGNMLLLAINYHCSLRQSFLHALFLSCALLLTEYLTAVLIGSISGDFLSYQTDVSSMLAMILISKLLYLVLTSIAARIFARQKMLGESLKITVLFCSMPIISLGLSLLSIKIGSIYGLSKGTTQIVLISISSLIAVNLLFLILYNYTKRENAEKLLLQISIEKGQAETAYYQALHEEKESRSILLHDVKNHLGAIASLADQGKNEEISAYISDMRETLFANGSVQRCNDPILDLILHRTFRECEENGIRFYYDIRDCCDDYLDAPDKTALFSNLLSNAVEAAKTSGEKEIDFSIRYGADRDSIVITTENSCDKKPDTDIRGHYRTSKDNARIHGIGLRSIARIIKKHNGLSTMRYDEPSRKFYHIVYLKIQKAKA